MCLSLELDKNSITSSITLSLSLSLEKVLTSKREYIIVYSFNLKVLKSRTIDLSLFS